MIGQKEYREILAATGLLEPEARDESLDYEIGVDELIVCDESYVRLENGLYHAPKGDYLFQMIDEERKLGLKIVEDYSKKEAVLVREPVPQNVVNRLFEEIKTKLSLEDVLKQHDN